MSKNKRQAENEARKFVARINIGVSGRLEELSEQSQDNIVEFTVSKDNKGQLRWRGKVTFDKTSNISSKSLTQAIYSLSDSTKVGNELFQSEDRNLDLFWEEFLKDQPAAMDELPINVRFVNPNWETNFRDANLDKDFTGSGDTFKSSLIDLWVNRALENIDRNTFDVSVLLDEIPDAFERANLGLEQARAGATVNLDTFAPKNL
jgi:hypothetical protein